MTLPAFRGNLIKEGSYSLRITEEPEKRRFGKATGIIVKFSAVSSKDGTMHEGSDLIFPWEERYRTLKDEIIKSDEESDWVGRAFIADIVHGPHPTKPDQIKYSIQNIEPFPTKETKDTTPPPEEEEGDPGPGEEEDPYPKEKDDSDPPF